MSRQQYWARTLAGSARQRPGIALTVAALTAAACVVQYKSRQAERKHPPSGQFIEVDGVRLHYIERGEGQPLVFLHGNGITTEDYDMSGLSSLAATTYRVIEFDRPGFGYSDRPRATTWTPSAQAALLQKALQQLNIERPIVVGHSWGTLVAMAWALDFPDAIKAMVLLSGYYYPSARVDAALQSMPAIPVVGDLMRYTVSPLLARLLWSRIIKRAFAPAPVTPQFAAYPPWMSLRPSQLRASAAESGLMVPMAAALSKRYHELKVPLIIMAGEDDHIVDTWHQSVRLHDELHGSDLRILPDAGHMIHHQVPQQVLAAIDSVAQHAQSPQAATLGQRQEVRVPVGV